MNTAELKAFYQVLEQCHRTASLEEINAIITGGVRTLMPHTMCAYGIGDLPDRKVVFKVNLGFPEAYLQEVISNHGLLSSPVAKQWSETGAPVLVTADSIPRSYPAQWQKLFSEHGIGSILAHGLLDMTGKKASYFTFASFVNSPGEREVRLTELLVPHLHVAITKTWEKDSIKPAAQALSKRECEILKWVYRGKTNAQIGELLFISEFTVKNHIKNILDKLGATNRTHAVAKAVSLGLVQPD